MFRRAARVCSQTHNQNGSQSQDPSRAALHHHNTDFIHRWPQAFGLTAKGSAGALRLKRTPATARMKNSEDQRRSVVGEASGVAPRSRASIATLAKWRLALSRLARRICVYLLGPRSPASRTALLTGLASQGLRQRLSPVCAGDKARVG